MGFLRRSVLVLVVLLSAGGDANAESAQSEKQARRSFDRAEAHFKAGLFAEALAEYQEGYEHKPLPGFLINIAQCQRRLGDLEQARATYRKFILVAPDSPYVPEVESLVAELDKLLESATTEPQPTLGEGPVAKPSTPDDPISSGPTALAPAPAVPARNLVTAPAADLARPGTGGRRWWLWGSVGGAIAVGTVAAILLLRSPDTTTVHDGSLGTLRR